MLFIPFEGRPLFLMKYLYTKYLNMLGNMHIQKSLTVFALLMLVILQGCGTGSGSGDTVPLLIFNQITNPAQLAPYPNGNYSVQSYFFEGDILNMQVSHNSCEEHNFGMIMSSFGQETEGVYGNAFLAHENDADRDCAKAQNQTVEIDFTPLKNLVEETGACTTGIPAGQHRCVIQLYGPHGTGSIQQQIRYEF